MQGNIAVNQRENLESFVDDVNQVFRVRAKEKNLSTQELQ